MGYGFNAGEVFEVAIQIEENGRKFYEESQKLIESVRVKALFADLAQQEIEHKKNSKPSGRSFLPKRRSIRCGTLKTIWMVI